MKTSKSTARKLGNETLDFIMGLKKIGAPILSPAMVKDEIMYNLSQRNENFDYVKLRYRKQNVKIQFEDRGYGDIEIDVEEFIPM